tara:strand:+ start:907 stop:1074 length:168 start_codon:yes stop_codon:yes gene_type:complete
MTKETEDNQKNTTLKAMERLRKERERKRELGIGGRYSFELLKDKVRKLDTYDRGD